MADAAPFTAFLAVETHRQEIVSTRKKSRFKFTYGARFVAERHGFGSQLVHFLVGWQLLAVRCRISPGSWNRWENLARVSGWIAAFSCEMFRDPSHLRKILDFAMLNDGW